MLKSVVLFLLLHAEKSNSAYHACQGTVALLEYLICSKIAEDWVESIRNMQLLAL